MQGNGEIPIKIKVCVFLKRKIVRHHLDLNKSEYFLGFIFSGGMLQDVAYGVTKIEHDSGEEQKIVYAILTTKFSHCKFLPSWFLSALIFKNQTALEKNFKLVSMLS